MKISEQARKATRDIQSDHLGGEDESIEDIIQTAINDHERDLVEAAQGLVNQAAKFGAVPIDAFPLIGQLKAALDRRKE